MNEATPLEIGTALATFITLRAEFYHLPTGEPEDKTPASDGSVGKRKGKAKN